MIDEIFVYGVSTGCEVDVVLCEDVGHVKAAKAV